MAKRKHFIRQLKLFTSDDLDELIKKVNSFVLNSGAFIVNYSLEEKGGTFKTILFYEVQLEQHMLNEIFLDDESDQDDWEAERELHE